jgi:hypothetical protein
MELEVQNFDFLPLRPPKPITAIASVQSNIEETENRESIDRSIIDLESQILYLKE